MSVADLTNTAWCFKYGLSGSSVSANINFTTRNSSNTEQNFTSISYSSGGVLNYNSTEVYNEDDINMWQGVDSRRAILITGGTDVTNSTLIQWIESNAVPITLRDLTDTKWIINDAPLTGSISMNCSLNFISNNSNCTQIKIYRFSDGYIEYTINSSVVRVFVYNNSNVQNTWSDNAYKTISITGGSYATNLFLIYWLEQNATLLETYKHLTFGDSKIQVESAIRDEDGNKLETVYALKTDTDNITATDISIDEEDSTSFTVTITFSESEIPDKQAVYVYDGVDTSGTIVFSDTNSRTATPPATVTCSTGYLYIRCVGTAQWINDVIRDVTGSITSAYAGPGEGGPILITVSSSGSFTMSVDYDF